MQKASLVEWTIQLLGNHLKGFRFYPLPEALESAAWSAQLDFDYPLKTVQFIQNLDEQKAIDSALKQTISCWGSGKDQQEALFKACAEAIERIYLFCERLEKNQKVTSNGVALHTSDEIAKLAAASELIERDLFLCHYYAGIPFFSWQLQSESPLDLIELSRKSKIEAELGIKIDLFHLGKWGVLVRAQENHRWHLGLAYKHKSKIQALNKAYEECLISVIVQRAQEQDPIGANKKASFEEFKKLKDPHFEEHGALLSDPEFTKKIAFLFERPVTERIPELESLKETEASSFGSQLELSFEDISYSKLLFEASGLEESDEGNLLWSQLSSAVKVYRASHANYQDFVFGIPTEKSLNLERLHQFAQLVDLLLHKSQEILINLEAQKPTESFTEKSLRQKSLKLNLLPFPLN